MSAATRAEARRRAIMSRGTDRLARLTTSARGEDASAFTHDDPPLPSLDSFVGEDRTTGMPTPRASPSPSPQPIRSRVPSSNDNGSKSRIPSNSTASSFLDSSVWTEEQQQQFMSVLMGGPFSQPGLQPDTIHDSFSPSEEPSLPPMLTTMLQANSSPVPPGSHLDTTAAPPTRLQKIMPFVHLVSMWGLVAYFVFVREPRVYEEMGGSADIGWRRWAELGRGGGREMIAELVPFFWIFTTLQIILHSLRIFSGFDTVRPPAMLNFVLPHLPPPFPSLILSGHKYLHMGSLFLDDIATLMVGFGFIVLAAGW